MFRCPLALAAPFLCCVTGAFLSCDAQETPQGQAPRVDPPRTSLSARPAGKLDTPPPPGSAMTSSLHDLLDVERRHPLEASGLALIDGSPLIVFDHFSTAASVARDLATQGAFHGEEESDFGYEGLTFDARTNLTYALVESVEKKKRIEPEVHVYDASWNLVAEHQVDFEVEDVNKGMEGLGHLYFKDTLYLFMLCEGNQCKTGGDKGEGRVHVFRLNEDEDEWLDIDRVKLPEALEFEDYSGLDIRHDEIVITSQEESAFVVGQLLLELDEDGEPDWKMNDLEGSYAIYDFPRDEEGKKVFCNVEGVSYSLIEGEERALYFVSDRRKPEQKKRCEDHDQSIHRVDLP